MVDRLKVETVLARRFPGASERQIADAANALMGLGDEWEEVVNRYYDRDHSVCLDGCGLAPELEHGTDFRLFRRREV